MSVISTEGLYVLANKDVFGPERPKPIPSSPLREAYFSPVPSPPRRPTDDDHFMMTLRQMNESYARSRVLSNWTGKEPSLTAPYPPSEKQFSELDFQRYREFLNAAKNEDHKEDAEHYQQHHELGKEELKNGFELGIVFITQLVEGILCDVLNFHAFETSGLSDEIKKAVKEGTFDNTVRHLAQSKIAQYLKDPKYNALYHFFMVAVNNHWDQTKGTLVRPKRGRNGRQQRQTARSQLRPRRDSSDSDDSVKSHHSVFRRSPYRSQRRETPQESPKRRETPRESPQESPKRAYESPKRAEESLKREFPKRRDSPKRESPKSERDTPKRRESPLPRPKAPVRETVPESHLELKTMGKSILSDSSDDEPVVKGTLKEMNLPIAAGMKPMEMMGPHIALGVDYASKKADLEEKREKLKAPIINFD